MLYLYYPHSSSASQPQSFNNVTDIEVGEYSVDVHVKYQSITHEVIITQDIVQGCALMSVHFLLYSFKMKYSNSKQIYGSLFH